MAFDKLICENIRLVMHLDLFTYLMSLFWSLTVNISRSLETIYGLEKGKNLGNQRKREIGNQVWGVFKVLKESNFFGAIVAARTETKEKIRPLILRTKKIM